MTVAAAAAVIMVLLVGCGDPNESSSAPSHSSSDVDPSNEDVAPECEAVERLVAEPAEEPEPTPTGEPTRAPDDGASAEPPRGSSDGEPAVAEAAPQRLPARIQQWGQRAAEDSFAGVWLDQGGIVVAFAKDVDRYAREVREQFRPGLAIARARHSYAELRGIQDDVSLSARQGDPAAQGAIRSTGVQVTINRTTVGIFDPTRARLAELSQRYGTTAICFEIEPPPSPPTGVVTPLAKVDGWRDGFNVDHAYAVLEIAYDRATAEQAWRDNVPATLGARNDPLPAEPGRYGDIDDVDFDHQVVVVWSTGQSGSCPEWVTDVTTLQNRVRVATDATADTCTSDYNPYRMMVAVDRDRVPPAGEVAGATLDLEPEGIVSAYPYDG